MTPGARVAAAIEVLNAIQEGRAAEQALTHWARTRRFAGSKDRAAIRDYVFDVLRRKRLCAYHGGGEGSRPLMVGSLFLDREDLSNYFNGLGHALDPLHEDEQPVEAPSQDRSTTWDLPDWLVAEFETSLGPDAARSATALQQRAPVFLRVNLAATTVASAISALQGEGIETQRVEGVETALCVTSQPRRIRLSQPFLDGLVELQDAASQAVAADLPAGQNVLDYCAGGGGKSLAIAAQTGRIVAAHDIDPTRMRDLPDRADRAGAHITLLETAALPKAGPFDLVFCDAPCSGSGAWRRSPEGKSLLTPERLAELTTIQDTILDQAADLVGHGGALAFATCSVLRAENEDRRAAFLARHPDWHSPFERRFPICDTGDGFYTAHFKRV